MHTLDLEFFALVVPAVLLVGIAKGGFGGGLSVIGVPMMALAMAPARASAILLPILLLMDLFALRAWWQRWDATQLRLLIPGGVLGTVLGALTFKLLSMDMLRMLVGVLAIVFPLQHLLRRAAADAPVPGWRSAWFWGAASGFTSFSVHAGGPPLQVYLLSQRLDKRAFQGTSAAFFLLVNWLKLPPYIALGLFDASNLGTSLLLAPLAPLGIAAGRWLHGRVDEVLFFRIVHITLPLIGAKLIWDALR